MKAHNNLSQDKEYVEGCLNSEGLFLWGKQGHVKYKVQRARESENGKEIPQKMPVVLSLVVQKLSVCVKLRSSETQKLCGHQHFRLAQ